MKKRKVNRPLLFGLLVLAALLFFGQRHYDEQVLQQQLIDEPVLQQQEIFQ